MQLCCLLSLFFNTNHWSSTGSDVSRRLYLLLASGPNDVLSRKGKISIFKINLVPPVNFGKRLAGSLQSRVLAASSLYRQPLRGTGDWLTSLPDTPSAYQLKILNICCSSVAFSRHTRTDILDPSILVLGACVYHSKPYWRQAIFAISFLELTTIGYNSLLLTSTTPSAPDQIITGCQRFMVFPVLF